jgi:hypothetical protein
LGKLVELLVAGCGLRGSFDVGNHNVQPPRFVDAATLAEACARGAGWPDWLLIDALAEVKKAGQTAVADGSPLVSKLARILQNKGGNWTAQAGEWLEEVNATLEPRWDGSNGGPKTAGQFSKRLTELLPSLEASGWTVQRKRIAKGKRDNKVWVFEITAPKDVLAALPKGHPF